MFTIVVPVLNQHDATEQYLQSWFDLSKSRLRFLFIDNGSDQKLSDQEFINRWSSDHEIKVIRNDENTGVYPTFRQGYENTDSEFIFYSHNDVSMIEYGWDQKLLRILDRLGDTVGVAGMFGAKRIGTNDIYRSPYNFTQMMRGDCITTASMADGHGSRLISSEFERVIVLDGYSLICSRKMIDASGRFDHESFPPHHMYDIDICVSSHYAGFNNYAIDVDCIHHGGVTSTRERWAEKMNTSDFAVHRKSHRIFYDKWNGKLPIVIGE